MFFIFNKNLKKVLTKNKKADKMDTTKTNNNSKNKNSRWFEKGVVKMNLVKRRTKVKTTIKPAIQRHPVPVLGIDYKVEIIYQNTKITELTVENKTIKIILPNRYKKMDNKKILDVAIDKMYEQIAKVEIERAMEKTRIMVGFAPEEYEIKTMKTLGKCENKKIILHPEIVKYSRKVIDYVVLHQYCHLKYKNHTQAFFDLLKTYLPDYKKCEEILLNL